MRENAPEQSRPEGAFVLLGADGHFEDASPAALELLGRSLEELRHLSPRAVMAMSDAESQALSDAWKQSGFKTFAGEATVVRPHGERVRVKFLLTRSAEDHYRADFEPIRSPATASFVVYTLPELLAAWRVAERRLAEAAVGSSEWQALSSQVSRFRDLYQALVAEKSRSFEDLVARDQPVGNEHPWR